MCCVFHTKITPPIQRDALSMCVLCINEGASLCCVEMQVGGNGVVVERSRCVKELGFRKILLLWTVLGDMQLCVPIEMKNYLVKHVFFSLYRKCNINF